MSEQIGKYVYTYFYVLNYHHCLMYEIIIITVLNIVIMNQYNKGISITVTYHL